MLAIAPDLCTFLLINPRALHLWPLLSLLSFIFLLLGLVLEAGTLCLFVAKCFDGSKDMTQTNFGTTALPGVPPPGARALLWLQS